MFSKIFLTWSLETKLSAIPLSISFESSDSIATSISFSESGVIVKGPELILLRELKLMMALVKGTNLN